jgi:hypothetical protein
MRIFKKAEEEEKIDHTEERQRMMSDREFWTSCIHYIIDEGMTESGAERTISVADKLLEARRERFPL